MAIRVIRVQQIALQGKACCLSAQSAKSDAGLTRGTCHQATIHLLCWMEHSGNAIAPTLGDIWSGCRSRARDRHWLEYSDRAKKPARIQWTRIVRQTSRSWAFATRPTCTTFLPQEAGGTVNLNIANGGDGTVQLNLRGFLPKETLILVDGKRVAYGSLGVAGSSQSVDINLIPFPMIDHIDILKDGASAVYGADAVAGVVNFFLVHKFRGLEIGGSYGNTNLGASNEMGEWEAWLKAGTGDDKTDIVVIADFWELTGGLFSSDRDISSNAFQIPWGGFDSAAGISPAALDRLRLPLDPEIVFQREFARRHTRRRTRQLLHFISAPVFRSCLSWTPVVNPNAYPGAPGIIGPNAIQHVPQTGTDYKGGGDYFFYNFAAFTPALPPADRQSFYGSFIRDICDKYLQVFADFKFVRSFFDSSLAAVPFAPDPFKVPGINVGFSPSGISVPISNPFNPFTVADATLDY